MSGSGDRVAPSTSVRGGSHGLLAGYAGMHALAAAYDRAGNGMREQAAHGGRVLADGDLLASALLSPATFVRAEAAVGLATGGPDGLLVQSLRWEADALLVEGTVTALQASDATVAQTWEALDYTVGRVVGAGLGAAAATAPVWLPVAGLAVAGAGRLPDGARAVARSAASAFAAAAHDGLAEHPGVAEHAAAGAGGLLDGFWDGLAPGLPGGPGGVATFTPTTGDAAAALARFFPDEGRPQVEPRPDLGGTAAPPTGLAGLLERLDTVAGWSADADGRGTVEVQSWDGPDGRARHVVYLPGTDDMTTLPWTAGAVARDLPADLRLVDGQPTALAEGVTEAMARAGVRPGEPVLLVGHSQGGLVAGWLAAHGSPYRISQVVTAGSPIGGLGPFPAGTQVLSLENAGDLVPLLDGAANPPTPNHVTVAFDDRGSGVVDSHGLAHYVRGAVGAEASADPSLVDHLDGLRADGFLGGGGPARTQVFQISRAP